MRSFKRIQLGVFAISILMLTLSCSQIQVSDPVEDFAVTLPQRAYWNSNVTAAVKAAPGSSSQLTYITLAGNVSTADGLGQTIATTDGICSLTWIIGEARRKGYGRIIISVNGVSETHFIELWSTN